MRCCQLVVQRVAGSPAAGVATHWEHSAKAAAAAAASTFAQWRAGRIELADETYIHSGRIARCSAAPGEGTEATAAVVPAAADTEVGFEQKAALQPSDGSSCLQIHYV